MNTNKFTSDGAAGFVVALEAKPATVAIESPVPGQLESFINNPRAQAFFGEGFAAKMDVLLWLVNGGGSLAAIGRKHGISRAAVSKHAIMARRIFGASIQS